jgi:fumarate hydratase subunit beta
VIVTKRPFFKGEKMEETVRIRTPLTDETVKKLKAGDKVLITGVIYTGRDAAHKRLVDLVQQGKPLPFDIAGQILYYVGPTPPKPGQAIGSAGPTTSYRMDAYTPILIEKGLRGMIGKGSRGKEVTDAMKKYKAVYFAATGGAGALISKRIKKSEIVAYEDLGAEAIRRLEVEDFPATVVNDVHGNDLYEEGKKKYRK